VREDSKERKSENRKTTLIDKSVYLGTNGDSQWFSLSDFPGTSVKGKAIAVFTKKDAAKLVF
jgi:hypothetical protein